MPTLSWVGKEKVVNHHLDVPVRELKPAYTFGVAADDGRDGAPSPSAATTIPESENKIIHGDSLDALKALLPQYEGRVKCIYIDPPYNTGNEGWVYNDNVNDPHIQKWLGAVVGKEGEDFSRHDKWLCMMYPRLKLLRKLLSEDGAIFISIDDVEQAELKIVCDEIFGRQNFLATFVWQKRYSPDVRRAISDAHEFIYCYGKNPELFKERRHLLPLGDAQTRQFSNPDHDPRGPWKANDFTAPGFRPNQMYEIALPSGRVATPPKGRCWRVTKEGFERFKSEGKMLYGNNGDGAPAVKRFLSEMPGMVPWTWLSHEQVGHSQEGNKQLSAIFEKVVFDYPKPERLIEYFIRVASDKDSIVLDSFAGSGTTAHAVLKANQADGGNRKFILVEMCDYAETVTAERVKRVIRGYGEGKNAVPGTGGDFTYYEIGEPILVDGVPNPAARETAVKDYVWFTETRSARGANRLAAERLGPFDSNPSHPQSPITNRGAEPALLGVHNGVAYYYWHDEAEPVVLNRKLLHTIRTKAESYVIYADLCALGEAELAKFRITFKKVSRDVARI